MTEMYGVPFYRDAGHITDFASYQLGTIYLKTQANPFALASN
jgi:hypothetical protein